MALTWPALPSNCIWNYDTTAPDSLVKISIWNADGTTQMESRLFTEADAYKSNNVEADLQQLIDEVHANVLATIDQYEAGLAKDREDKLKLEKAVAVIETNKP